jgi:hypothetical protein
MKLCFIFVCIKYKKRKILCFMKAFILIFVASLALFTSCVSTSNYFSLERYRYQEQKIAHFNYIPEDRAE